jgi:hypothetical protein
MSKTYDYKSLVDIYVSIPEYDYVHKDFRSYREALLAKLEELLGISIKKEYSAQSANNLSPYPKDLFAELKLVLLYIINPKKRPKQPEASYHLAKNDFVLWELFAITVDHIQRSRAVGVAGAWLEGGPQAHLDRMQTSAESELITKTQNTIYELQNLENEMNKSRYQLLYQLIELFFSKIDKIVTSEELLAAGFDDSKEPQLKDYYDYM